MNPHAQNGACALAVVAAFAVIALTGCGRAHHDSSAAPGAADAHEHTDEHGHVEDAHADDGEEHAHDDHHGHEAETLGADFDADAGLWLAEEAAAQIGLRTTPVTERELSIRFTTDARIYETAHAHFPESGQRAHHDSHAVAMLSFEQARVLAPGLPVDIQASDGTRVTGTLAQLDRGTARAIGEVEAIINVPDPEHRFGFGSFAAVTFQGGERLGLAVPRSAVVAAASGTFVYQKSGGRYRRTVVQTGIVGDDAVEITQGLSAGDIVVTQGALDLWLIELRFTKGGGHSH